MYLKNLFLFIFVTIFSYSSSFDWDVCKYGKDSSILYSIYTDEEISFHCSLHAKEMIMLKHPSVVKHHFEINKMSEPPRRLRRSAFNSNSILELIEYCSQINYITNDCGINIRQEILKQISNMTIDLESKQQLQLISDLLYFYDFSLYFTSKKGLETIDFIETINKIKWGIKIKYQYLFQDILWRIVNILNNFIIHETNSDNINKVLVTHEKIFSNILQWKLLKLDFIFQLFFNPLNKVQLYKKNEANLNRATNFVLEMSNIINNNIYFKHEIDTFKLYTYSFFVKNLNKTEQEQFKGKYTSITEKDIFNLTSSFRFGNIDITIFYQHLIDIEQVKVELVEVYQKFSRVFYNFIDIDRKNNSKIIFRIFNNRMEYTKYGPILNFATNNGGITFSDSSSANIYCYGTGNSVLNLGHEFVHGLVYIFFRNAHRYLPIIHEGLAEAIGQKTTNIPVALIENVYKNNTIITYEDVRSSNYDNNISPYGFGFIIFSTLINNGYTKDLVHSLNTFGENNEFKNLIEENLNDFKKFSEEYIRQYYLELRFKKYRERERVPSLKFKQAYQNNYPGNNIVIVIDNTYFYLYKEKIILHHPSYPLGSDREILNDIRNENDFKYLISFGILTSIKQIPNYHILYPEIFKKKETIELYKDDAIISNKKLRERIFNSLFNIGNDLGINTLHSNGKTFYEIKDYIKDKVDFDETQYYKLSVPNWNTTSNIQKAIHSINSGTMINMTFLRSIDQTKSIDIDNRILSEIFSIFFPINYLDDSRITQIVRSIGKNYLKQNIAITKQFTVQFTQNTNTTEIKMKEIRQEILLDSFEIRSLLNSFKNEIFEIVEENNREIRIMLNNNLMYYNQTYSNLREDFLIANKYEKQLLNEIFLEIKKINSFDNSFGLYDDISGSLDIDRKFKRLELIINDTLSNQEKLKKAIETWNNINTFFSENTNVFITIIFFSSIIILYFIIYHIVKKYYRRKEYSPVTIRT